MVFISGYINRYLIEPLKISVLLTLIRASYAASGGVYGSPRVFLDLREAGETCGKHRVARIMRNHQIKALRGYKAPRSIRGRPSIIVPHRLQRNFTAHQPNQSWVTDITYIRTWQGWLYLAVVMDLFARNIVGWSMKPTTCPGISVGCVINGPMASKAETTGHHWPYGVESRNNRSSFIQIKAHNMAAMTGYDFANLINLNPA